MQVREVMTHGMIGVAEGVTVAEAIETMLRSRVSALFVFDANNALIGVVSQGDFLRRDEVGSEGKRPGWLEFLLGRRAACGSLCA
jgi:predicted transcriptional regulator